MMDIANDADNISPRLSSEVRTRMPMGSRPGQCVRAMVSLTRATGGRPATSRSDHWLREAILILVSVALGFGASEFSQYRQERGLARRVLQAVVQEVKQNEAELAGAAAKHREWEKALAGADPSTGDKAAFWLLIESRPQAAGSITVTLKSAAWQMVVSSGALRLMDFEVGQAISYVYSLQTALAEYHGRTSARSGPRRRSTPTRGR